MSENFQSTTLATSILANLVGASTEVNPRLSSLDYHQPSAIMENDTNLLGGAALNSNNNNNTNWTISEEDELKILNFPPKREDLSTAIPLTVIFGLLFLTGCIGNLCTAIVIARPKNKYMHTATNYYLFSLAMSDFLFLILGLPQEMYTLWQRYPYAFGDSFCIIRGYLSEASTYASILTISAFTIERYVAICHPLWAHTMSQLPRAITSILVIWLLAAICAIPPAAELGIDFQRGPVTNRTLPETAQCVTKRVIYENMFVVSAIVFFIVPMIIVTILYILIALELRRSSKMNNAISSQSTQHHQLIHPGLGNHRTHNHHPHQHHRRHHLCAARGSRSQQHLNDAISSPPASPFTDRTLKVNSTSEKGGEGSLMDNIMSQRPSSAIGTEHLPAQSLGALKLPFSSYKWPFAGWSGHQTEKCDLYHPVCCRHQQLNVSNKKPSIQLTTTRSNQYEPVEQASCVLISESPETATRNHSPLSYHESLIERHPHAHHGEHTSPSKAHPRHPKHQLSLQVNSIRSSSVQEAAGVSAVAAAAALKQQSHQHHCNHQHNPQSHQHHPASSHRRSAVASSKKSVVRMLGARSEESLSSMNSQPPICLTKLDRCGKVEGKGVASAWDSSLTTAAYLDTEITSSHSLTNNEILIQNNYIIVAVVVSFFICWVPFHAQRLLASYLAREREENDTDKNQFLHEVYLKLTYISGIMYYLSSTINPLLYQLMSAKFRLAFKETFKCSLFKCAIFSSSRGHRASGCSPSNSLKCQIMDLTNNSRQQTCQCCCSSSVQAASTKRMLTSPADCSAICMANSDYSTAEHLLLPSQQFNERQRRRQEHLKQKRKLARFLAQLASYINRAGNLIGIRRAAGSAPDCNLNCTQCVDQAQSCCARSARQSTEEAQQNSALCPASPFLAGTPTTLKFTRSACRMSNHEEEDQLSTEQQQQQQQQLEQLVQSAAVKNKLPPESTSNDDEDLRLASSPESGNLSGSSGEQSQPCKLQQQGGQARQVICTNKEALRNNETSGISQNLTLQQHQLSVSLLGPEKQRQQNEQQRRKSSSVSANKHLLTHSSSLSSSDRQLEKKFSLSTTTSAIDDCSMSYTNSQLTAAGSNQALKDDDHLSASASSASSTGIEENERITVINVNDDSPLVLSGQE